MDKLMRITFSFSAWALINEMIVFFKGIFINVVDFVTLVGIGCFTTGIVMVLDSLE